MAVSALSVQRRQSKVGARAMSVGSANDAWYSPRLIRGGCSQQLGSRARERVFRVRLGLTEGAVNSDVLLRGRRGHPPDPMDQAR